MSDALTSAASAYIVFVNEHAGTILDKNTEDTLVSLMDDLAMQVNRAGLTLPNDFRWAPAEAVMETSGPNAGTQKGVKLRKDPEWERSFRAALALAATRKAPDAEHCWFCAAPHECPGCHNPVPANLKDYADDVCMKCFEHRFRRTWKHRAVDPNNASQVLHNCCPDWERVPTLEAAELRARFAAARRHSDPVAAAQAEELAVKGTSGPLYLDLRARLPANPDYASILRAECNAAGKPEHAHDVSRFMVRVRELFGEPSSETSLKKLDEWLHAQCGPGVDFHAMRVGEIADMLDAKAAGTDARPRNRRKTTPRGAPQTSDPGADKKLLAAWQVAKAQGASREGFCRECGIDVQELIDAQQREKYRRARDAE
jgi:hypothetical protein